MHCDKQKMFFVEIRLLFVLTEHVTRHFLVLVFYFFQPFISAPECKESGECGLLVVGLVFILRIIKIRQYKS